MIWLWYIWQPVNFVQFYEKWGDTWVGDMKILFENFPPLNVKFIYSEKATKFWEISTLLLSNVVPVKSKVEISQKIFWPSNKYMNITYIILQFSVGTCRFLSCNWAVPNDSILIPIAFVYMSIYCVVTEAQTTSRKPLKTAKQGFSINLKVSRS